MTVILITYGSTPERTEYAVRTVRAVAQHLRYPNWSWYFSDDGSGEEHLSVVTDALLSSGHRILNGHSDHISYGAGVNLGLQAAFGEGDLVLMLEDDWELSRSLDVWKYAALLMERPDIGMVRMGYLNAGLAGTLLGHNGTAYWVLDDT